MKFDIVEEFATRFVNKKTSNVVLKRDSFFSRSSSGPTSSSTSRRRCSSSSRRPSSRPESTRSDSRRRTRAAQASSTDENLRCPTIPGTSSLSRKADETPPCPLATWASLAPPTPSPTTCRTSARLRLVETVPGTFPEIRDRHFSRPLRPRPVRAAANPVNVDTLDCQSMGSFNVFKPHSVVLTAPVD